MLKSCGRVLTLIHPGVTTQLPNSLLLQFRAFLLVERQNRHTKNKQKHERKQQQTNKQNKVTDCWGIMEFTITVFFSFSINQHGAHKRNSRQKETCKGRVRETSHIKWQSCKTNPIWKNSVVCLRETTHIKKKIKLILLNFLASIVL